MVIAGCRSKTYHSELSIADLAITDLSFTFIKSCCSLVRSSPITTAW